jgi:Fe-S-cluster containining protein
MVSRSLLLVCSLIFWEKPAVVSSWTAAYQRKSSRLRATGSDNDEAAALEQALASFHPAETSWYASGLPFHCTECGKCCRTQGSVYMSPSEVEKASFFLQISIAAFLETYASRTLQEKDSEETPWVRLINNNDGACIFLNANNQCNIYEVRPVQCSTYPYWPSIMESEKKWNAEVRTPDDCVNESIPYWTPHNGGCEGMKLIGGEHEKVVSPYVAYEQLMEYVQSEQSFPNEPIIRRVERKKK